MSEQDAKILGVHHKNPVLNDILTESFTWETARKYVQFPKPPPPGLREFVRKRPWLYGVEFLKHDTPAKSQEVFITFDDPPNKWKPDRLVPEAPKVANIEDLIWHENKSHRIKALARYTNQLESSHPEQKCMDCVHGRLDKERKKCYCLRLSLSVGRFSRCMYWKEKG